MNAEFLKGVGLFQGLNNDQLADEILMLGMVKDYKKGAVIFEEGAKGDRFYIVYTGATLTPLTSTPSTGWKRVPDFDCS